MADSSLLGVEANIGSSSSHNVRSPLQGSRNTVGFVDSGSPGSPQSGGVAGGANAKDASGTGVNKARALEDFLNTFPDDDPRAGHHMRKKLLQEVDPTRHTHEGMSAAAGLNPATGGKSFDADMRKFERDAMQKRAGREAVKNKLGNTIKKQKIETWVTLADKNNQRLKRENDALQHLATLTQENCMDNDARFDEAITGLRTELEFATIFRQNNSELLDFMTTSFQAIQDRATQMKEAAVHQSQQELANIREAFERQLDQQNEQLSEVRASGKSTTGMWKDMNQDEQAKLEEVLLKTDAAYVRFRDLEARNARLRVEHSAQENDGTLLENKFRLVSAQHNRLKDRLHDLEVELAALQEPGAEGGSDRPAEEDLLHAIDEAQRGMGGNVTQEAKMKEYKKSLTRAQALLEQETQNLKEVRYAHIMALKQRTELEVFLRQAIANHRRNRQVEQQSRQDSSGMTFVSQRQPFNVAQRRGNSAGAQREEIGPTLHMTAFAAEDRREVIDTLLAQPRVLELLYQQEGIGAGSSASNRVKEDTMAAQANRREKFLASGSVEPAGPATSLEEDVTNLWEKWKMWTSDANAAFATAPFANPREEGDA